MRISQKGFTLLEIMIVVALIGILLGVVSISAGNYLKVSRDSTRATSVKQISEAVLAYYSKYGKYPAHDNGCVPTNALIPEFAKTIPKSPGGSAYDEGCGPNGNFAYAATDHSFAVIANMEKPVSGNYSGATLGLTGTLTREALATVRTTSTAGAGKSYVVYQAGYDLVTQVTGSSIIGGDTGGGDTGGGGGGGGYAASIVNGVCSSSVIGGCLAGDSLGSLSGASSCGATATWSCNGQAGGTTASCSKVVTCFTVNTGSSGSTIQTVASGTTIAVLTPPARNGYSFGGWSTATGGSILPQDTVITSNATYYAQWTCAPGSATCYPGCNMDDITVGSYVLAACNVGSSIAGTGSTSYGNYFQWGRNKGFSFADSSQQASAIPGTVGLNAATDTYGYVWNSGFAWNTPWATTNINDNWGHVTNTLIARQGPCATGYHIPTVTEWDGVLNQNGFRSNISLMRNTLYMPLSGVKYPTGGYVGSSGVQGSYWTSQVSTLNAGSFNQLAIFTSSYNSPANDYGPTVGLSVRCFRNPTMYTVSYDANGGVGGATQSIASGSTIGTFPANPTRSGYAFNGWFTTASGGTQVATSTSVTGNITYYAQWTLNIFSACTAAGETYTATTTYPSCDTPDKIVCTGAGAGKILAMCNVGSTIAGTGSLSYGHYFQWNRNDPISTNGTTLIPTTTLYTGSFVYGGVNLASNPTFAGKAIQGTSAYNYNWLTATGTLSDAAWGQGPCAAGYHVPTTTEWNAINTATSGWANRFYAYQDILKIPPNGFTQNGLSFQYQGQYIGLWSASVSAGNSMYVDEECGFHINSTQSIGAFAGCTRWPTRSHGTPVRCMKD